MPQMSPMLWIFFPFVVMVLGVVVMVFSMKEDVEVGSELLGGLSLNELKW